VYAAGGSVVGLGRCVRTHVATFVDALPWGTGSGKTGDHVAWGKQNPPLRIPYHPAVIYAPGNRDENVPVF